MARRSGRGIKKRNVEELVSYFYGINAKHEVKSIAVYVKGKSVRLSGPHGSHNAHSSNSGSLEGWKRETALVWNLTDVIDIPRVLLNSESGKKKVEELETRATEKKRAKKEHLARRAD